MALQLRKSKTSWIRLSPLMLSLPSMSFRVKRLLSMWNSTTHMIGKTLPSWRQNSHLIISSQKSWDKFLIKLSFLKNASGQNLRRNITQKIIGSYLRRSYLLMLRHLGMPIWQMNFVSWLENMVVRFQEHHKLWKRKKRPTIWHKGLTIRL